MARSPRLVCVLAGRRVRPGSRRPRVERGVWSEVREGVGWGRSGSVWDRLRFPLPLPSPSSGSDLATLPRRRLLAGVLPLSRPALPCLRGAVRRYGFLTRPGAFGRRGARFALPAPIPAAALAFLRWLGRLSRVGGCECRVWARPSRCHAFLASRVLPAPVPGT